ncbi:hypothetical protein VTJ83DRAFT_1140 [Remersonia thermophila]|uniref:Zn(2)-C6 fungal-type domain-containing protein n=1 Tax=Remersonia thermophila TaxID=72144 RepID=A0ABR4DQW9_9PEZI
MTRPKVPDDKRQRTAQACDSCKRRKQKCNGLKPCQTCERRKLTCSYTPNNNSNGGSNASDLDVESAASPTKRRHIDTSQPSLPSPLETPDPISAHVRHAMSTWGQTLKAEERHSDMSMPPPPAVQTPLPSLPVPGYDPPPPLRDFTRLSNRHNAKGLSEETNIYTETRMLQDQTGRLLYIGDASTLSILQLIRIIVENTAGREIASPFIDDPKRHRILECVNEFPDNVRIPGPLPDKQTTDVLVASYFTNTCGLIEVFDKTDFLQSVEECYRDPLSSSSHFLCNLYLVLALGLLLAAPVPGTPEAAVIEKQLSAKPDRAELFFRSARSMCDPETGFEDADFWSIQALSLMTLYMLILSKRNTAYAYLGMAVRSSYALGLHREETMHDVIFSATQMRVRRNLWKSLYILDRFLAATLGRPTAISEDDCSRGMLQGEGAHGTQGPNDPGIDPIHATSLDSCVETCRVIGVTLKVFSRKKISTTKVQEIIDMSKNWDKTSPTLSRPHSGGGVPTSPAHGIASLHSMLFSLHSLILLTRQLFVMHNWMLVEERSGIKKTSHQIRESPMARFSEACVIASYRTIQLAGRAWKDGYLPRRNPFVIYFMFAASLVVLMNQFSSLYHTDDYAETMNDAIMIVEYCAEIDPQARRVLDIIQRFSQVVTTWTKDHAYPAPSLSNDFSCLSAPIVRPTEAATVAQPAPDMARNTQIRSPQQVASGLPSGLPSTPSMSKAPLRDLLSSQVPNPMLEARINGASPPQVQISAGAFTGSSPSISGPSPIPNAEPPSGNIEFEFDGLWNNFISYLPPVSTVAPNINFALQFPAPVLGPATEPYGVYSTPQPISLNRT